MTLRELLKDLQKQDENALDASVLVSERTGTYREISHISVLYVGHVVIHLEPPKLTDPKSQKKAFSTRRKSRVASS